MPQRESQRGAPTERVAEHREAPEAELVEYMSEIVGESVELVARYVVALIRWTSRR